MAIRVVCSVCQADYNLKDEFAGRELKCTSCQNIIQVPAALAPIAPVRSAFTQEIDPAFQHDKFLFKQRILTIQEQYDILDKDGQPLMFVERPVHYVQNLSAGCLALIVLIGVIGGGIFLGVEAFKGQPGMTVAIILLAAVVGFIAFFAIFFALMAKRHITIYGDKSRTELLLEIRQDFKFILINAWFTVLDHNGEMIARFRKNYLHNFFRRRWYGYWPDGSLMLVAMEDSVMLALLRRFLGPLFGVLRTNYVLFKPDQGTVIGEFNRKFTLLDRFVLDMNPDRAGYLDRRLAVTLGILIDTSEKV
jgi:hypothetical protein